MLSAFSKQMLQIFFSHVCLQAVFFTVFVGVLQPPTIDQKNNVKPVAEANLLSVHDVNGTN